MSSGLQTQIDIRRGTERMIAAGILARATITLQTAQGVNIVRLNEITIRNGNNGPWVAYPAQKDAQGKVGDSGKPIYYKFYHMFPDNKELRESLERKVIEQFNATPPASAAPAPQAAMPATEPAPAATPAPTAGGAVDMLDGIDLNI
jgi:DNA-binding cell septation regulator SpoVG